jgi:hypothetical protein
MYMGIHTSIHAAQDLCRTQVVRSFVTGIKGFPSERSERPAKVL